MKLTADEIAECLDALRVKHGAGYSNDWNVRKLQSKLSMMLELSRELERMQRG